MRPGADEMTRGARTCRRLAEFSTPGLYMPGSAWRPVVNTAGPDGHIRFGRARVQLDAIRQEYYYLGGSDDMGIGNRSCYIRMVFTDTGTDAYILAAFQKANVVVEFDFVPGYADLSLSDLKNVAWEQYDKIQN